MIEGFATFALESDVEDTDNYQMKFLMLVLAIKLLMIYIIAKFIWPRIMPSISSSIKSKPGFINILGLSLILHLL